MSAALSLKTNTAATSNIQAAAVVLIHSNKNKFLGFFQYSTYKQQSMTGQFTSIDN